MIYMVFAGHNTMAHTNPVPCVVARIPTMPPVGRAKKGAGRRLAQTLAPDSCTIRSAHALYTCMNTRSLPPCFSGKFPFDQLMARCSPHAIEGGIVGLGLLHTACFLLFWFLGSYCISILKVYVTRDLRHVYGVGSAARPKPKCSEHRPGMPTVRQLNTSKNQRGLRVKLITM